MNSKWVEAQVTIFAALVYSVVVSLIVATVNSAAFSVGFLNADLVTYAGVSSEFSQFFRPLADNFNVFGLEIIEDSEKEMENYMQYSLKADNSLMPVKLSGVTIKNSLKLTDNCGLPMKEQIVKYMKYGAISEVVNMLLGNDEYKKKCDTVKSLNESLMKATDILIEMDKNMVNAVEKLDGLATADGRFVVKADFPVYSGDTFLKMGMYYEDSNRLGIIDGRVYSEVHKKCQNMSVMLTQIHSAGQDIYEKKAKCDLLINLARDCRIAGLSVIDNCKKYKRNVERLNSSLINFGNELEGSKEIVGQEVYDGLKEESKELKQYVDGQKKLLFNPDKMIAAVSRNNQALQTIEDLTRKIVNGGDNADSIIEEIRGLLMNYDFSDMVVDYSDVKFIKDSGVFSVISGLKKNFGKGLMTVITEGLPISKEKFDISSLAISKYSRDKDKIAGNNTSLIDKALFVDYLRNHFDCFSKNDFNDGGLKYDLEFIYGGSNSDEENLSAVLMDMVNLREGSNLIGILSDSQKKQEAYALSTTLLGFTGSAAIIKAGQYLIMAAWAYAESIMDVKRLVNGDKLELFKSKADWKMTLQRLLAYDFSYTEDRKKSGLDYKTYIVILMMLEKDAKLYYATMAAMEMRLITLGYEAFRMENFLYEMNGIVEFLIRDQVYEKEFGYKY